jgi:hypothetical protein
MHTLEDYRGQDNKVEERLLKGATEIIFVRPPSRLPYHCALNRPIYSVFVAVVVVDSLYQPKTPSPTCGMLPYFTRL